MPCGLPRRVIFPYLRDVTIVAGDGSVISGSTAQGFSLAVSGDQLLCIFGDPGAFLPTMVVTMGTNNVECEIDKAMSNSTVTYARVPPITTLCDGDETCLLRGTCVARHGHLDAFDTSPFPPPPPPCWTTMLFTGRSCCCCLLHTVTTAVLPLKWSPVFSFDAQLPRLLCVFRHPKRGASC